MSFQNKLTILMPSYNKADYIKEAVSSVLRQKTTFEIKLIITDDGSTDGTLEIALDYQKNNPDKIIVLPSPKNHGLLSNILKAYRKMDSEYFCCLDPDDYWTDDNFLQEAVSFLDKHPQYSIYAANTQSLFPDGSLFPAVTMKEAYIDSSFADIFTEKAVLGNTISSVFRNIALTDNVLNKIEKFIGNPYNEHSVREDDFRNRIHLHHGKAHFVNKFIGIYRSTPTGLFQGSNKLKKINLKCKSYIDMYSFFDKKYPQFIDLAKKQIKRIESSCIKGDLNRCLKYPLNDVSQFLQNLREISLYDVDFKIQIWQDIQETRQMKKPKNKIKRAFTNLYAKLFK